jgi:hypothetical protein
MSAFTAARDYWPAAFEGATDQQRAAVLEVRVTAGLAGVDSRSRERGS